MLKETGNINKSLFTLGKVISALGVTQRRSYDTARPRPPVASILRGRTGAADLLLIDRSLRPNSLKTPPVQVAAPSGE